VSDPITRADPEALIEEARRRARRRRQMYAAVVASVALVGVAILTVFDRTAQSQSGSPAPAGQSSLPAATEGSLIAYTYNVSRVSDFDSDLYVMNPDGTGKRRLTRNAWVWIEGNAWSPDGQKIVFGTFDHLYGDLFFMNADGTGRRRLVHGTEQIVDFAWSPDGRKVAFASGNAGGFGIYVANGDGSGTRRLTPRYGVNPGPTWYQSVDSWTALSWAPDGRKLTFTSGDGDGWEIYIMNADGTGLRNLTRKPGNDHFARWSPDGRKIAFASDRTGNFEVYVMNADGSGQTRLTHNPGDDVIPSWSPDGRRIAFRSSRDAMLPTGDSDIRLMNADGTAERSVTRAHRGGGARFAWSPDGRKLAFQGGFGGDVYVVNADGSGRRNLSQLPARVTSFAWSPARR
jgi:TolB protein